MLSRGCGLGATVSHDTVRRRAEILEKDRTCTARIRSTQARIDACKVNGLDASVDEKWMATELDLPQHSRRRVENAEGWRRLDLIARACADARARRGAADAANGKLRAIRAIG